MLKHCTVYKSKSWITYSSKEQILRTFHWGSRKAPADPIAQHWAVVRINANDIREGLDQESVMYNIGRDLRSRGLSDDEDIVAGLYEEAQQEAKKLLP